MRREHVVAAELEDATSAPLFGEADGFDYKAVAKEVSHAGNLSKRFGLAPFTVFNARMGGFQERKRLWVSLGLRGEEGRQDIAAANNICSPEWNRGVGSEFYEEVHSSDPAAGNSGSVSGTSIYDPVICDAMYGWFAPRGGRILDPFAGGSTRGCVAAVRGFHYTGIEIRPEQVEANQRQAPDILAHAAALGVTGAVEPQWVLGDSSNLSDLLLFEPEYDLLFACPPYYDLEIYSTREGDGSAYTTYENFLGWYKNIFAQAVAKLKNNRFAVITVGEIRDKKLGWYRNFVGDTVTMMQELGLHYYNEAILVTAVGSLPVRIGKQFGGYRKFGKTHQNLLVFYKGESQSDIPKELGELSADFSRGTLEI